MISITSKDVRTFVYVHCYFEPLVTAMNTLGCRPVAEVAAY